MAKNSSFKHFHFLHLFFLQYTKKRPKKSMDQKTSCKICRTFKNPTFVLSISKKGLKFRKVVDFLHEELNLPCSVTENCSILSSSDDDSTYIEDGCQIIFQEDEKHTVESIWEELQQKFSLKCAHLVGRVHFNGCVYDYLRPSDCPSFSSSAQK